jgi:tetratricopeptide (TPR) repeat protein
MLAALLVAALSTAMLWATVSAQDSKQIELGPTRGQKTAPATQRPDTAADQDRQSADLEEQRRARRGPSSDPREQRIDELTAQLADDPNNATLLYQLGNAYQEAGYLHSALQHFTESVRIDSTNSRAWNNRGSVLKDLNRHDEAIASFERALAIDPQDVKAHVNLGDEYLLQKRYQQAVDKYRQALAIDPKSVNAFYSLAISFAETGMYRDAARCWRRAAELETEQHGADSEIAKRAIENAKLMEEIVADAQQQIKEREEVKKQLEAGEKGGEAQPDAKEK